MVGPAVEDEHTVDEQATAVVGIDLVNVYVPAATVRVQRTENSSVGSAMVWRAPALIEGDLGVVTANEGLSTLSQCGPELGSSGQQETQPLVAASGDDGPAGGRGSEVAAEDHPRQSERRASTRGDRS